MTNESWLIAANTWNRPNVGSQAMLACGMQVLEQHLRGCIIR